LPLLKLNFSAKLILLYSLQSQLISRTQWSLLPIGLHCCVCLSVCRLYGMSCGYWLNGASQSKSYYWQPIGSCVWEIDWYQNDWPWPMFLDRIKSRWCQPLQKIDVEYLGNR